MSTAETATKIVIVDCGHGNLRSVVNALRALEASAIISSEPGHLRKARALIFPGQGAAPVAMRALSDTGLGDAIVDAIVRGVPTLGICLGMQVALGRTDEGSVLGLDLVHGACTRFVPSPDAPKVPQIGWNRVRHSDDPLFAGIPPDSYFYFVHSYYCLPDPATAIGWTEYGIRYCSALRSGSFWATQFHPEKSGPLGLRLLGNFLRLAQC